MKLHISLLLRCHIKIFQLCGYCTLPFKDNLRESLQCGRWLRLWSCLLMVAFNITAYVALFSNEEFLFPGDKFGYFNDALKVLFANIAATCSYLESILKRTSSYEFWVIHSKLQKQNGSDGDEIHKNRRFIVMFYMIMIIEISVLVIFFLVQDMNHHLILFWSVFVPFIFTVHLRNMQFIFYIELIRHELVKLQHDLSLLVDYSRFQAYGTGFRGFEEFLRSKIAEKQKIYQLIYEMYEHFQNAFGLSIVAVLLMIYVRVLVDSYFSYYTVYRGWKIIEVILLIPAAMHIPMFLITSKCCMDVVKFITLNLHSIISQFNSHNTVVSVQVQNFSLQILHQRICINGVGITRMDGYMLTRAIGSITTYMIFFIQFMPKFTNT